MKISRSNLVVISLVLLALTSCATLQTDQTRTALYGIKQSWTEIRTYVISKNINGAITDAELADFKLTDSSFSVYYDLALTMYLANNSNNPDFTNALDTLRDLLLKARQKYYKEVK